MSLKLTQIHQTQATVTFKFQDEDVTVVYRSGMLTPVLRLQLIFGSQSYWKDDKSPKVREMRSAWKQYHTDLASILVSWDVLGDDGEPLVPDAALLEQMPNEFVNALITALLEIPTVNPQNGKDSKDTSQPAE